MHEKNRNRLICMAMAILLLFAGSFQLSFAKDNKKDQVTNEFIAAKSMMYLYEAGEGAWNAGNIEVSNEKILALLGSVISFEFGMNVTTHSILGNAYELNMEMTEKEKKADRYLDQVVGEIITDSMNAKQKIIAIHDWIVLNTIYNENPANKEIDIHQLTGPALYGQGVCDGYAKMFMQMCHKVNIPCLVIVSRQINHAWNLVYDGSQWKMVDATWDDPVPDMPGRIQRQYLLFSKDIFGEKYLFDEAGSVTLSEQEYMDFAQYYYSERVLQMNNTYDQMVLDGKIKTRSAVEYVIKVLLFIQMKGLGILRTISL